MISKDLIKHNAVIRLTCFLFMMNRLDIFKNDNEFGYMLEKMGEKAYHGQLGVR